MLRKFLEPSRSSLPIMNDGYGELLSQWRQLMNSEAYFEAHEVLEPAWMAAGEPVKTFLKGLIHASVALCHYQRGNGHGARVKCASAVHYLSLYPDRYLGLSLAAFLPRFEAFFAELTSLPPGSSPPPPGPWPQVDELEVGRE